MDHDPRLGRHNGVWGHGFGWVLTWSLVGAILPGLGLIMARRRLLGSVILTLFVALGLGGAALAIFGDPVALTAELAASQRHLLTLAAAATLIATAWTLVVLSSYLSLSKLTRLVPWQQSLGLLLVTAIGLGIMIPTINVDQYALIQRDLVGSIFKPGKSKLASTSVDPWASKPRVNLLLLGSDAGPDRVGLRTDTMVLASINTRTGDTVMFSLPRNLEKVPFPLGTPGNEAFPEGYYCPGHQECMLNSVWEWALSPQGEQFYDPARYPNPGLAALEDAIAAITGLRADDHLMINLRGFIDVVNALGGITVNIHERLPVGGDAKHPWLTHDWLEPGPNQHLDGYHALWFARSRYNTSDYSRMGRQRCAIAAIVKQAQPTALVGAFPRLAAAAKDNVSSDISTADLPAWTALAVKIKKADSIRSLSFTRSVVGGSTADPDYEKIRSLVTLSLEPGLASAPMSTPFASTLPSATATATPGATTTPGATPSPESTDGAGLQEPSADPEYAQNVSAVC